MLQETPTTLPSHKDFSFVPKLSSDFYPEDVVAWSMRLDDLLSSVVDDYMVNKFLVLCSFRHSCMPPVGLAQMSYLAALSSVSTRETTIAASKDFAHHIVKAVKPSADPVGDGVYSAYALFQAAEMTYVGDEVSPSDQMIVLRQYAKEAAPYVYREFAKTDVRRAFIDNEANILENLAKMKPATALYESFSDISESMLAATPDISKAENAAAASKHLTTLLSGITNVSYEAGDKIDDLVDVWGRAHELLAKVDPEQAKSVARVAASDEYNIVHPKLWSLASERIVGEATCTKPSGQTGLTKLPYSSYFVMKV